MVRKAANSIGCAVCLESLTQDPPSLKHNSLFTLLNVKNRGRLVIPSDDVIDLLIVTETILRTNTTKDKAKRSYNKLLVESEVLAKISYSGVFATLHSHMFSTAVGLDNHLYDLIRTLVSTYYNLCMSEIVRRHNILLQGNKIRSKCTKLILFKGQ